MRVNLEMEIEVDTELILLQMLQKLKVNGKMGDYQRTTASVLVLDMALEIRLKHKESDLTKIGCYGFSWTYLFFGPFVPMFRGELGVGALHIVFAIFSAGISNIILAFIYNKQYLRRQLENGWVLAGEESQNKTVKEFISEQIELLLFFCIYLSF